ncbi:hypothetical protein [Streptomyces sp. ZL-24]|uniref:hypothetical protein n=1 Tax=Streptomyces sp. ZL-24 TaxID=1933029 RepID=UPI0015E1627B|nr:hypothetical protein [Streptomyces sp. ZL-24]
MSHAAPVTPEAEDAYRALLDHTTDCARCKAKKHCPRVVVLSRQWKEARRR